MFRVATSPVTYVAALLGVAFKGTNVSFLVSLAFSVAAGASFRCCCCAVLARPHAPRRVARRRCRSLIGSTGMLSRGSGSGWSVLG